LAPSDLKTRAFILCISHEDQVGEVDLEEPQLTEDLVFYLDSLDASRISLSIEERIYRLERDDQALLKRIKDTNLRATGVDSFLNSRLGGSMQEYQDKDKALTGGLLSIVDKKKILEDTRFIC